MISFKITQELTCEKICKAVQKILSEGNHLDDILVIDIKQVSSVTDEMIPKLTYTNIYE